ncbi:MAG TPA: hypothetical protein VIZ58_03855 [Thermoanaerobaculia bacterium]
MVDPGEGRGPADVAGATPFRDRSRALTGFGWLLIAAGAACGLLALSVAAVSRLALAGSGVPPLRTAAFNVFFYVALGACFVVIGIGSIRARRWARALALTVGWIWLATGCVAVVAVAAILPAALSTAGAPASSVACGVAVAALILLVFCAAIPLAVVLFYRRDDVRRTVEWRQPAPDWSDRVPSTILGVVIALAFGGVACLVSVPFLGAVPLLGSVLTGAAAAAVLLVFAALSFLLAWGSWRQSAAAWWGLVAFQVFSFVNFLTLRSLDMPAYMRQAGYPEDQVRQVGSLNILASPAILWTAVAVSLLLMGFLVAIRRHFRGPQPAQGPPRG